MRNVAATVAARDHRRRPAIIGGGQRRTKRLRAVSTNPGDGPGSDNHLPDYHDFRQENARALCRGTSVGWRAASLATDARRRGRPGERMSITPNAEGRRITPDGGGVPDNRGGFVTCAVGVAHFVWLPETDRQALSEALAARHIEEEANRTIKAAFHGLKATRACLTQVERMASLHRLTAGITDNTGREKNDAPVSRDFVMLGPDPGTSSRNAFAHQSHREGFADRSSGRAQV